MTLETRLEQLPQPNKSHLDAFTRHKLLAGLSEQTVANYLEHIIRFLDRYGQDKDLMDVTREDIESHLFYLRREKNLKPSSIQSTVISFRVFFSDLLGREKGNALLKDIRFKVPLVKVREEQLLTHEEIQRMMAACYSERDRALIATLYSSGCREGELLGLKIKDVMFTRNGASIHVKGKTGERDVDLFVGVPELKSWYNVHPHRDDPESPFWVTYGGVVVSKSTLTAMLIRVAKRAGIPDSKKVNPHSFRHRRATDCAEFLTVADMKEMFGWTAGSNMHAVYVHSSRQRVKEKLMAQAGIKVPEQHMPTMMVKQCPVCGCINTADATICYACSNPLDEMDAKGLDMLRKKIEAEIMKKLTDEKEE